MRNLGRATRTTAIAGALCLALAATVFAGGKLSSSEWRDVSKKVRKTLKAGPAYSSQLASLLAEVAADDSKRAVKLIESAATENTAPEVFDAARDALAGLSEPDAVEYCAKKLSRGSGSWGFRVLLADAFSRRSDNETIVALNEALEDRQDEVVRAVLMAIESRRSKSSIEPLIARLEEFEKKEDDGLIPSRVREVLESLTGEDLPKAVDWRNWWNARKNDFHVNPRPTTGGKKKEKVGGTVSRRPKFFGTELKSRNLCFVIDVSGSMQATDPAPPGGTGRPQTGGKDGEEPQVAPSRVRVERAKWQLKKAIEALPDGARFTVISYSGALIAGQAPKKNDPIKPKVGGFEWLKVWSKKLVPANKRSKGAALKFVDELKAEGGTFTYRALRTAFMIPDVDNIIILSDGAPNDPDGPQPMTTDDILNEVKRINNFRKVVIDTFGFEMNMGAPSGLTQAGPSNPFVDFLKKLAKQNSGKYTPIK